MKKKLYQKRRVELQKSIPTDRKTQNHKYSIYPLIKFTFNMFNKNTDFFPLELDNQILIFT